jgi:hypothetical protein
VAQACVYTTVLSPSQAYEAWKVAN